MMDHVENPLITGDIRKTILKFAFPIFLGSLFQQFYNMADAVIVGNYAGDSALAAVTSTGTIIFLFIGFFIGMYQGMGVVIARYYGAKDQGNVKKAIDTATIFGAISGVFLTILGISCSSIIIELVGTPEEVYQQSVTYLRVYFMGALFLVLYNTICGICRALGDSRRPLYYLMAASLTNNVLDILFVGVCGMGVAGAGLATAMAQGVSTILALHRLRNRDDYVFLR